MLKLYRGLLDVLKDSNALVKDQFVGHIRTFNDGDDSDQNMKLGVKGFWNLILEMIITAFMSFISVVGLILIFGLAVVSFPLYAIKRVFGAVSSNIGPSPRFIEEPEVKKEPQ
jgi:hypothetical protein